MSTPKEIGEKLTDVNARSSRMSYIIIRLQVHPAKLKGDQL